MVNQFLRKWTNSPKLPSLFAAAPALVPCPFSAPSRAVVVVPALVPGPSTSALACRRCRRAGSRPWPVGVRSRLPSAPPRVPLSSRRLSSLGRQRPPLPAAVVFSPGLLPGLSASALACRQRPLACRSRRAALVPCLSASALACLRCHRRRHVLK